MGSAQARGGLNEVTVATGTATQLAVACCFSDDDERPPINDQLYLLPLRLAVFASLSPTSSVPADKYVVSLWHTCAQSF